MRRFELVRGLTRRFWHVSVEGAHVTVTTGIAGTLAQPLTATFPSSQAAQAEEERLVKERLSWGYVELESAPAMVMAGEAEHEVEEAAAAAQPPPAPLEPGPDAKAERAERAARAAAARKAGSTAAAKGRRSGPSKK